jgi:hypothetical protein
MWAGVTEWRSPVIWITMKRDPEDNELMGKDMEPSPMKPEPLECRDNSLSQAIFSVRELASSASS